MRELLADMGTPMMWAGPCHLLVGNLVIGVGEGLLLKFLFNVRIGRAIGIMVLANYVSMGIGALFFRSNWALELGNWFLGEAPLYRARALLSLAAIGSYVLTILLEWPFIAVAFRRERKFTALRSLLASLTLQTASYAVLALFYGVITDITLLTQARPAPGEDLHPAPASVYFLSGAGRVMEMHSDGTAQREVAGPYTLVPGEALALVPDDDNKHLDLALTFPNGKAQVVRAGVAPMPTTAPGTGEAGPPRFWGMSAADLRPAGEAEWQVYTGVWATIGLSASNKKTGESYWLGLETPFFAWYSRSATILPGDQVIYEVGGQVVLLDLATRRVQFLVKGRSPVVVLAEETASGAR